MFDIKKYDAIYNRMIYLIGLKTSITYILCYYFSKIKVGPYDSLSIEKTLPLHNLILLIRSVLNKDKNHYCYKIFLEKCLNHLIKK